MRIRDWSSDVCSSDLDPARLIEADDDDGLRVGADDVLHLRIEGLRGRVVDDRLDHLDARVAERGGEVLGQARAVGIVEGEDADRCVAVTGDDLGRSEEHTSELQSLLRISYAGFCLKNKKTHSYLAKHG